MNRHKWVMIKLTVVDKVAALLMKFGLPSIWLNKVAVKIIRDEVNRKRSV